MMNEYSEKTAVRTRRMPFRPGPESDAEQSMNVLPVGTHLGEFEILDLIGEGGFGIVYLAYDHSLERHVALKEYMPSGLATRTTKMAVTVRSQRNADTFTAGLKSFINEARMLAQFDSASLVKVHRFWEGNGTAYMVMPFYEGITLKQALKERRINPSESWIRVLLADLFDAIETIHGVHCLHRDIAPDNILLLKDGRPLLLDFGAARRVIGDLTQRLTVILKPGFAPIEQYANSAGLRQGEWTDIYALAAVVYYLISGKAPPAAVARMVHDEMVPATEIGKGRYSTAFLSALDKALAVRPEQRFRSIAELRRALDIMDTVPRTLPRSSSHWSTTVAHTVPLAEGRPEPVLHHAPEPPPQTQFQAPMEAPHDMRGRKMHEANKPAGIASLNAGKPAWLVLGLLLLIGIAAGIYWGTQRWQGTAMPPPESSSGEPPLQSSGSSAMPQSESIDQSVATAPPAASASSTSPPVATQTPPKSSMQANETPAPTTSPTSRPQVADSAKPGSEAASQGSGLLSEVEVWRMASTSDKASAYEGYLREYPKGRYAALAKLRLERMQPKTAMTSPAPAPAPAAPKAEKPRVATAPATAAPGVATSGGSTAGTSASGGGTKHSASSSPATQEKPAKPDELRPDDEGELWRAATAINEGPAYEAYLNLYPKGRYAALAKDKLGRFKSVEPPELVEAPKPAAPAQVASSATNTSPRADEKTAVPETPPAASAAPETMDKQASIKPAPEPGVPPVSKPSTESPKVPAQPVPATPPPTAKKTIRLSDQTMIGDFSADPKTGIVSGTGKIVWTNGNQFEGTLVRGSKEGKGKFTWSNGQRYSGDWARDMPNGKGTIVFANGNRYEGDVKDGVPHGQGINRFKDGDVYSGAWVNGKSHGQGRYTWANGSYWEG
ncbi:MAG TPA: protein kinase, partial [Noviherbaspirillum sp.]|nr:protein kinase [Noviherbaspirillum sp.]